MKKRNVFVIVIMLLCSFPFVNAQENEILKKGNKAGDTGMGMGGSMMNVMKEIASDSTMRMQMLDMIVNNTKGDSASMKQMCKKMVENPEMKNMMMKVMHQGGQGMRMKDNEDSPSFDTNPPQVPSTP